MGKGSNKRTESFNAAKARWQRELKEYKEQLLSSVNQKLSGIKKVVDENAESLKGFVVSVTQRVSMLNANVGIQQQAIEQLDIRGQIHGRLLLQVWGRLQQVDHFLQELGISPGDISSADTEHLKGEAKENFESSYVAAGKWVTEFREAEMKERRRQAEEAAKRQEEKDEAVRAEEELVAAEKPSLVSEAGGQGAEPPEGAEIFGG